jgi:hypothetical protein
MMMKTNQTSIKQNTQKRGRARYKMKDPSLGKKKKPSTKAIVMTFLVRECYGSPKKQEF